MSMLESKSGETWCHSSYDPDRSIIDSFNAQTNLRPDAVALVQDGRRLTYRQLAAQAGRLAGTLRAAGARKGDRIAIHSARSIEMVAAQLAVMSIGAAFVPIDPASPEALQRSILDEAGIGIILSGAGIAQGHPLAAGRTVITLAPSDTTPQVPSAALPAPEDAPGPEDLAYVIYTSGSTGRPKGVMVAHRGICRLVKGQDYADMGPDQVILCLAAVGFDVIMAEIYGAILNGGTLAILPDPTPSLDRIGEVIRRDGVTFAYITAGLFHVIAEHRPEILAPLEQVCPCGDVLSETHVRRVRDLLPGLRIINGYGPTENSVFTCCYEIDAGWTGGPVPIGRGLAHDRLFILDDDLRPVPAGEVGQLAVGGAGVGIGYLGRPDLTAAAFVPFRAGGFAGTVYLTGDLVQMRPDGVVCFRGRIDRQIKVNGQRVELDAVEHAMRADPAVEDAAAVAARRPDGTRQIVAFVKPARADAPPRDLPAAILARLREVLPPAALPSQILIRDVFPLSASGKVDRKKLAAELAAPAATGDAPPPEAARDVIRAAWAEVLGKAVADDDRTFFDLGGTSLQLIAVHARLQERLGRKFDIARLFEAPRIRDLERLIGAEASAPAQDAAPDPVAASRAAMMRRRPRRRMGP